MHMMISMTNCASTGVDQLSKHEPVIVELGMVNVVHDGSLDAATNKEQVESGVVVGGRRLSTSSGVSSALLGQRSHGAGGVLARCELREQIEILLLIEQYARTDAST